MSQSMRICCSGLSPILQHKSSQSSSCMFPRRMEVGGGFPIINLSLVMKEECSSSSRKRASVVSNHNHNPRIIPFLPCATPLRNSIVDEGTNTNISGRSKYSNPDNFNFFKVLFLGASFKWWKFLYKLNPIAFDHPPQVNAEVVLLLILRDQHDSIEGLKVLLEVSRAWRSILCLTSDELFDAIILEKDDYVESYYFRKPRKKTTYKSLMKKSLSRMTTRLSILRLLTDLNDPNEGLQVMLRALDIWETRFILNDSGGYLQKEIFAILDLSQRLRILVSNRNDKHDDEAKHNEAKYPPSGITHVMEILKPMIDHFEGSSNPLKTTSEAFRSCNGISCPVVAIVANLNIGDICCLVD